MNESNNLRLQEVYNLEQERKDKGYKPGWLYYECKKLGLLRELDELEMSGKIVRWKDNRSDHEVYNLEVFQHLTNVSSEGLPKFNILPEKCHLQNIRNLLTSSQWKRIRKLCLQKAKNKCQQCGFKPDSTSKLDCHEDWVFDDNTRTQSLGKLMILCKYCHNLKHLDFHFESNNGSKLIDHFIKLSGGEYSKSEAIDYFQTERDLAKHRDFDPQFWKLDLNILNEIGFIPPKSVREQGVDLKAKRRKKRRKSSKKTNSFIEENYGCLYKNEENYIPVVKSNSKLNIQNDTKQNDQLNTSLIASFLYGSLLAMVIYIVVSIIKNIAT